MDKVPSMRGQRWWWIVLAAVLLLGAFAARYVSLGPGGYHTFSLGREVRDLPLISPTLLGWILPGDPVRIESAQYSPDGRWLYLSATRGGDDQLASVTLSRPHDGVLVVDVRLITIPNLGRPAAGLLFATRVWLDPPIWEGSRTDDADARWRYPPITIDASTGSSVLIWSYRP